VDGREGAPGRPEGLPEWEPAPASRANAHPGDSRHRDPVWAGGAARPGMREEGPDTLPK